MAQMLDLLACLLQLDAILLRNRLALLLYRRYQVPLPLLQLRPQEVDLTVHLHVLPPEDNVHVAQAASREGEAGLIGSCWESLRLVKLSGLPPVHLLSDAALGLANALSVKRLYSQNIKLLPEHRNLLIAGFHALSFLAEILFEALQPLLQWRLGTGDRLRLQPVDRTSDNGCDGFAGLQARVGRARGPARTRLKMRSIAAQTIDTKHLPQRGPGGRVGENHSAQVALPVGRASQAAQLVGLGGVQVQDRRQRGREILEDLSVPARAVAEPIRFRLVVIKGTKRRLHTVNQLLVHSAELVVPLLAPRTAPTGATQCGCPPPLHSRDAQ
eukprot:scaffold48_cov311-Pinguiococcus_pyrenoidosus.AAC.111